jgi:hypothetical protein
MVRADRASNPAVVARTADRSMTKVYLFGGNSKLALEVRSGSVRRDELGAIISRPQHFQ